MNHLIKSQQLDRPLIDHLFALSEYNERNPHQPGAMRGRIMATLFYEPSTRTRLSFESAMLRMGGQVLTTESAREFSSAAKGENIEDTIRVVQNYCDVIVLRHHEAGAAKRAARVSGVPVINAGDGPGQHPTQALIDLYTIQRELGGVDGVTIAMVGDLLNGRTVRSLCYLLSKYRGVTVHMVSPPQVRMKDDIMAHLAEHGVATHVTDRLEDALAVADVVYQTRVQKERFDDLEEYEAVSGRLVIDGSAMSMMRERAIVMHPLPRLSEIAPEVDSDPRAAYFRQASRAVPVRGAILQWLLGSEGRSKVNPVL
jgi:aspartate carbamoyltransferase catalytic subunit